MDKLSIEKFSSVTDGIYSSSLFLFADVDHYCRVLLDEKIEKDLGKK